MTDGPRRRRNTPGAAPWLPPHSPVDPQPPGGSQGRIAPGNGSVRPVRSARRTPRERLTREERLLTDVSQGAAPRGRVGANPLQELVSRHRQGCDVASGGVVAVDRLAQPGRHVSDSDEPLVRRARTRTIRASAAPDDAPTSPSRDGDGAESEPTAAAQQHDALGERSTGVSFTRFPRQSRPYPRRLLTCNGGPVGSRSPVGATACGRMRPPMRPRHPSEGMQRGARLTVAPAAKREDPRACRDLHRVADFRLKRRTRFELATLSLGS